jgi:hypothetical protein
MLRRWERWAPHPIRSRPSPDGTHRMAPRPADLARRRGARPLPRMAGPAGDRGRLAPSVDHQGPLVRRDRGGASQAVARPARVPVGRDPRDGADHAWGLGFVEHGDGHARAGGVPAVDSSLAVLAYRLVSYWLPLVAGAPRPSPTDGGSPDRLGPTEGVAPGRPVPRVPRCCHRRRHGYLRPNILRSTSRIAATRCPRRCRGVRCTPAQRGRDETVGRRRSRGLTHE